MNRISVLVGAWLAAFLASGRAAAESSRWDRTRDPALGHADRALAEAIATRIPPVEGRSVRALLQDFSRGQALMAAFGLEEKGGEALPDPEVLYFLGNALVDSDRGRDDDGRRILRKALAEDPASSQARHAWFNVAVASNRLLDFESETAAYTEALELEWDPDGRAAIYSNRAESAMSLGNLRAARDDYLNALDNVTSEGSEVYALAAWGLAVAYARDDDLPDALKYAWKASEIRFPTGFVPIQAIDLPEVFYTPDYEILFYRALGLMAASQHADGPEPRRAALSNALELWEQYLVQARKNGDRWVRNAEYQRTWCVRRLADLGVRLPSDRASSKARSGSHSLRPPPTRAPD